MPHDCSNLQARVWMPKFLSEKGLIERAYQIAGKAIKDLPLDQIYQLVTVTHYVTLGEVIAS